MNERQRKYIENTIAGLEQRQIEISAALDAWREILSAMGSLSDRDKDKEEGVTS